MRKGFWIAISLALFLAAALVPVVHLSGVVPQFFGITSSLDGHLRAAADSVQRATGIKTHVYWKAICARSSNCVWTSNGEYIDFILYPQGLVGGPDGTHALPIVPK